MRWKKVSNFILVIILTIAITITTLLNVIGPLHTNELGAINQLGAISLYSIIYFVFSISLLWGLYFYLKNKTELLFFILIVVGVLLIIAENFLWALMS